MEWKNTIKTIKTKHAQDLNPDSNTMTSTCRAPQGDLSDTASCGALMSGMMFDCHRESDIITAKLIQPVVTDVLSAKGLFYART